jgi:FMN-dependent NADH-azoreductase
MAHLLHIDSSSTPGSVSRQMASAFREVWDAGDPDGTVTYRDLVADPVPHVCPDAVVTLYGQAYTENQETCAAVHDRLVTEVTEADAILISAPMYNWTIPGNLKDWLDQVLIPGKTLFWNMPVNPLAGRPTTVVLAYGGEYAPGTAEGQMDHVEPYLRTVLEGVLGLDLTVITARLTAIADITQDETLIAKGERYRVGALEAVHDRAAQVLSAFVPV